MIIDIRIDDVASSNIKKIKYQANTDNSDMSSFLDAKGILTITYSNDSVYNYLDVPVATAGNLLVHESIGRFVAGYIKQMFESEKVGT